MSTLNPTYSLRQGKADNNAVLDGVFCYSSPSVHYSSTCAGSTDPFTSKTNKYAECKIVRIVFATKGGHVKWSSTGTAATTSDLYLPAEVPMYFAVDAAYPYLRVIETSSAATFHVTEIL